MPCLNPHVSLCISRPNKLLLQLSSNYISLIIAEVICGHTHHGDDDSSICITENLGRWNSSQPLSATLPHTHAITNTGIIYNDVSGLQNVIKCRGSLPLLQAQLLQAKRELFFIHMFNYYKFPRILQYSGVKASAKTCLFPCHSCLNLKYPFHKQAV